MNSSLGRMLLAALVLAATFLGGYLMGGGRSLIGGPRVRGESDALTMPGLTVDPAERVGKAEVIKEGQFGGTQRQRWTKERLLKSARSLINGTDEISAIRPISHLADQLDAGDFPLAMEVAKDLADRGDKEIFHYLMLMRWAELNPRAAADYLSGRGEAEQKNRSTEEQILFPIWARTDAAGAAAWARGLKTEGERRSALERIARSVAGRDPEDVLAFVQAHAAELLEEGKLPSGVVAAWENQPPDEAAKWVAANRPDDLFFPTRRWAEKDREAAWTWAQELKDPEQRAAALHGVFAVWATKDNAAAAAAFAKLEQPTGALKRGGEAIVATWPNENRQAAQAWVQQLPEGEAKELAFAAVVDRWAKADKTATAAWLEKLPEGPGRDRAAGRFASVTANDDREGAMAWALSIGDAKARAKSFQEVSQGWFEKDPGAAFEWMLGDDGISADQKRELLGKKAQ